MQRNAIESRKANAESVFADMDMDGKFLRIVPGSRAGYKRTNDIAADNITRAFLCMGIFPTAEEG